jgi:hypothetical protein
MNGQNHNNDRFVENLLEEHSKTTTTVYCLPDPGVEQQVAAALEPDARLQERLEAVALPVEAVDDVGAWQVELRVSTRGENTVREDNIPGFTSGALSM